MGDENARILGQPPREKTSASRTVSLAEGGLEGTRVRLASPSAVRPMTPWSLWVTRFLSREVGVSFKGVTAKSAAVIENQVKAMK